LASLLFFLFCLPILLFSRSNNSNDAILKTTFDDHVSPCKEPKVTCSDANIDEIFESDIAIVQITGTTFNYGTVTLDNYNNGTVTTLETSDQLISTYAFQPGTGLDFNPNSWLESKIPQTTNINDWGNDASTHCIQTHFVSDLVAKEYSNLGINFDKIHIACHEDGFGGNAFFLSESQNSSNPPFTLEPYFSVGDWYGNSLSVYDVIAHEFAHAYLLLHENLLYVNNSNGDSRATHEGIADIFGTYIEAKIKGKVDWVMSNDNGLNQRNLKEPYCYFGEPPISGLVHTVGKTISHWFYLITGDEELNIVGLGLETAFEIAFDATKILSSQPEIPDFKEATLAICAENWGACSEEYRIVKDAWAEVCIDDCTAKINEDILWDFDRNIDCNIYISTGSTLTIDGATIFMAEDKGIYLNNGGELNLINGAKITVGCENSSGTWAGITAWSSSGQIEINASTIEHAKKGVVLYGKSKLIAKNSEFLNNHKSVEFIGEPSIATNRSRFTNCNFITDDDFRYGNLDANVSMWAVDGVVFQGCDFINRSNLPFGFRGKGIESLDAQFHVTKYTASPWQPIPINPRGKFYGFKQAIDAGTSATNNKFNVSYCDFIDNANGILASFVDDLSITHCDFELGDIPGVESTAYTILGIKLHKSSGYTIAQNRFLPSSIDPNIPGSGNGNHSLDVYGTYIIDSGEEVNYVSENYFGQIANGNGASLHNKSAENPLEGLVYICNEFEGNARDIYSKKYPIDYPSEGICDIQSGGVTALGFHSANNCFEGSTLNIKNEISSIIYYYFPEVCEEPLNVEGTLPMFTSVKGICLRPDFPEFPENPLTPPNPCQDNDIDCNRSYYMDIVDQKNSLSIELRDLMDGGNTTALIDLINNADLNQIQTSILDVSPFLSESVMLKILDLKDSRFGEDFILQVLTANPELYRFNTVYNKLTNDLTFSLVGENIIANLVQMATERSTFYKELASLENSIYNTRKIVFEELYSDHKVNKNEILTWLAYDDTPINRIRRIKYHFMHSEYSLGNALITNMYNELDLNSEELNKIKNLQDLKRLETDLNFDYDSYVDMSEADKQFLMQIAGEINSHAGLQAANILNYFFDIDLREQIEPEAESQNRLGLISLDEKDLKEKVKFHPNPAKSEIVVDLKKYENQVTIQIFSLQGNKLREVKASANEGPLKININGISNGIYLIKVLSPNKPTTTSKLLIQNK